MPEAPDLGQGSTAAVLTPTTDPVPTPSTPPAAPEWLKGADDLTVGYVQNKGWKEPTQVLESYRNLEKLFGADRAGHTVAIPKPDAPKADWDNFYTRLGRPSEAKEYKIDVPEKIGDAKFAETAASWFHELGLTKQQGESLGAKWNEYVGTVTTASAAAQEAAFKADDEALKTEWGAAFTQNLNQAQAFVRGAGIDSETIDKLSSAMGHKATMQFFQKLGAKIGEADFVTGQGSGGFGAAMTPAQAQARIAELKVDKAWTARLLNKDAAATAEWSRLFAFAYPEEEK